MTCKVAVKINLTCAQSVSCFLTCPELIKSGDLGVCKYGERCTFAFNQLEIDIWTAERKGNLDRNFLFEKPEAKVDARNSIIQLLQENKGMFIYLCQVSVSILSP